MRRSQGEKGLTEKGLQTSPYIEFCITGKRHILPRAAYIGEGEGIEGKNEGKTIFLWSASLRGGGGGYRFQVLIQSPRYKKKLERKKEKILGTCGSISFRGEEMREASACRKSSLNRHRSKKRAKEGSRAILLLLHLCKNKRGIRGGEGDASMTGCTCVARNGIRGWEGKKEGIKRDVLFSKEWEEKGWGKKKLCSVFLYDPYRQPKGVRGEKRGKGGGGRRQ